MSERLIDIFAEVESFHWWFVGRRFLLNKILNDFLSTKRASSRKILDVGCGSGSNIKFLSQFGEVYGVDNLRLAVQYCKKRGYKRVKFANASNLPYPDNFFDVVTLLDVLEHIKDDRRVLEEVKRVLRPKGIIIITSPALSLIWSKHDSLQGHFRRYSLEGLKDLAKEVGVGIQSLNHYNVFLSPLIIIIRMLSRLKFFNYLGEYDSKINFDIAKKDVVNMALINIIKSEVYLSRFIKYPIGISVVGVFKKNR